MKHAYRLTTESKVKLTRIMPLFKVRQVAPLETSVHPFQMNDDGTFEAIVNMTVQWGHRINGPPTFSDPIRFEYDSGADICTMTTKQATALGYDPTQGEVLQMEGVDGQPFDVHMQPVPCQLPNITETLTFPMCMGDAVDCLLFGRYNAWNQFSKISQDIDAKQLIFIRGAST